MSTQARTARLHEIWNHQDNLNRRRAALLSRISDAEHFRFATLYPLPAQDERELRQLSLPMEEVLTEVREGGFSGREWGDEGDEWCGYHTDPMQLDVMWDECVGGEEQDVGMSGSMIGEGGSEAGSEDEGEDGDEDWAEDGDVDMDGSESESDSETASDEDSDMESPSTHTGDPDSEHDNAEDASTTAYLSSVAVFSDGSPDVRSHTPLSDGLDAPSSSDVPLPSSPTTTPSPTATPRRDSPAPPVPSAPTSAETLLEFEMSYNDIYAAGAHVWRHYRIQEHLRSEGFQRRRERLATGPRGPSGLRTEVLAEEVGERWEGWGPRRGW